MSEEDKIRHDSVPGGEDDPQMEANSENGSFIEDILGALGVRGSPHKQRNSETSEKEEWQEVAGET